MTNEQAPGGPTIKAPQDPQRRLQLEAKLEEYRARVGDTKGLEDEKDRIWRAPESVVHSGAYYRMKILEAVLRDGKVDTHALSRQMSEEMKKEGTSFDVHKFNKACTIIADYIETGGANVIGGGLPQTDPTVH